LTFSVIEIVVYLFVYLKLNTVFRVIGVVTYSIWLICYLITSLKNPGIPTFDNYLDNKKRVYIEESESDVGYLTCSICNVYVKKDTQIGHCLSCKICILGKKIILKFYFV
jgi:hypothetical protein